MSEPTSTLPNFTFGQCSVTRKLIINGGALRLRGLLLLFISNVCVYVYYPIVVVQASYKCYCIFKVSKMF